MAKLYIKNVIIPNNPRQRFHDFRWPGVNGGGPIRIAPGTEMQIGGDLSPEIIERIVSHYERHGAVDARSLPLRPGFIGLAYRIAEDEPAQAA
jgi:hypothetical protein